MQNNILHINEIFKSIDGEGARTGQPSIFIRFSGCNLNCEYCDTKYALNGNQYDSRYTSIDKVIDKIISLSIPNKDIKFPDVVNNITITGGEPLLRQKEIIEVLDGLYNKPEYRFEINIETNGSINPDSFVYLYSKSKFSRLDKNDLFFTFDIKTLSAGTKACNACINDKGEPVFLYNATLSGSHKHKNVIKAVVGSKEDLDYILSIYDKFPNVRDYYDWYISPVFREIEAKELVDYVLSHESCNNWRVQVQLHKIIWDPNERGV